MPPDTTLVTTTFHFATELAVDFYHSVGKTPFIFFIFTIFAVSVVRRISEKSQKSVEVKKHTIPDKEMMARTKVDGGGEW